MDAGVAEPVSMAVDAVPGAADEPGMDDLFGDEAANEEQEREETSTPGEVENDESLTAEEIQHRKAMEYAEDDDENEPEEIHLREAAVSIPSVPKIKSSDGQFWVLRLPNFIKLDSRPFHPQTYIGPEQHEEEGGSSNMREKSMSIKLQVENTIRWRWTKDKDGKDIKQSNCRIIRWSDGSQTLLLGKEQFEVVKTVDASAAPGQTSPSKDANSRAQGLTYLVAQHARSTILQAEAPITGTLSLRPMGMQSETHQMLVRAVGQKHNKVARLRMAPDPIKDPEREKMELLKSQTKKPRKKRQVDEDEMPGATPSRRRSGFLNRKKASESLWSDEEEEEHGYGSEGSEGSQRSPRAAVRAGGKERGEYQTDDFVVSDEEEEGDEEKGTRKKPRVSEEEGARDSLDEMDEKIEAEARRRKKRVPGGEGESKDVEVEEPKEEEKEEKEEKEVESEDEEEADVIRVRKSNRPKVIVEEEEEE